MKKILTLSAAIIFWVNGFSQNWLWARAATGVAEGLSVATDASGNVFVTGYFVSDSITFGTTTLVNAGATNTDIFLAKYDGNGNVLWAKSAGGTPVDVGWCVATDASGNVFIT